MSATPGPWLRIDTADYAEIHAQFRPSSQAIALVAKGEDADLIAAAPALLEALKTIVQALGEPQMDEWHIEPVHADDVAAARAAISLAGEG